MSLEPVQLFHVTSSRNREFIQRHGLDWTRMAEARGVAGSDQPEVDGIFLCLGLPRRIPADQLTMVERDRAIEERDDEPTPASSAYGSSLTITMSDGRVFRDDEALALLDRPHDD